MDYESLMTLLEAYQN